MFFLLSDTFARPPLRTALAPVLAAALLSPLAAQDRSQARSMVLSTHGMIATEHPLASQAGARVLAEGGNAIDAAIAANAVMGVVSPMMCGIGGDLFALVYEAESGNLYSLNASGWAPAGASIEKMREMGFESMPRNIHAVTVPGAVDGWDKLLDRFGTKTLQDLLAPAIYHAEAGFPVTEMVAGYWEREEDLIRSSPDASRTFLPEGRVPRVGSIFRNPDLAWSYRQLAAGGKEAFYSGPISERILALSQRMGGSLAPADLQEYAAEWVDPISSSYRGWTVYQMPPNGQGIAALSMLNLMEQFPMREWGSNTAPSLHTLIEAKKLAFADLIAYVTDPRHHQVPTSDLLSKDYARTRARQIHPEVANCDVSEGPPFATGTDTTYIAVADAQGNMVSLIQSIYLLFGSGLVPEGTGFALQNRGGGFSLDPDHPNALAGRKRTLHTIIPGFMERGDTRIAYGIMGGWNQAQAHAQFVSNVVDHGMNIQAALEAARFTKATFAGCDLQLEARVPESVRAELTAKGHQIEVTGDFSTHMGGGQAVLRDFAQGVTYGASDPRKDGLALPEPAPWAHLPPLTSPTNR